MIHVLIHSRLHPMKKCSEFIGFEDLKSFESIQQPIPFLQHQSIASHHWDQKVLKA